MRLPGAKFEIEVVLSVTAGGLSGAKRESAARHLSQPGESALWSPSRRLGRKWRGSDSGGVLTTKDMKVQEGKSKPYNRKSRNESAATCPSRILKRRGRGEAANSADSYVVRSITSLIYIFVCSDRSLI
jgi:hypothetical protein